MYKLSLYRSTWQPAVFKCSEKQSGYNKILAYILAATSPTRTYAYVYTTNSSTRRRVFSWRHVRPHQVRWRPECRLTHRHFRDRLLCLRPLFLSFPFFYLLRSWLLWLPLFLLGCFSSSPRGLDAGRLRLLSNFSTLDSCM